MKAKHYIYVALTAFTLLIAAVVITYLKHLRIIHSAITYQDLTNTVTICSSLILLALAIPALKLLTGSQHVLNKQTEKVIEAIELMRQTSFTVTLLDDTSPFITWSGVDKTKFNQVGKSSLRSGDQRIDLKGDMYLSLKTTQDIDRLDMLIRSVYFPVSLNKPFSDFQGNFGMVYIEDYRSLLKSGIQVIDTSFQFTVDKIVNDNCIYKLSFSDDYKRGLSQLECLIREWNRCEQSLTQWLKRYSPDTYKELNLDHGYIFRIYPKIDPR